MPIVRRVKRAVVAHPIPQIREQYHGALTMFGIAVVRLSSNLEIWRELAEDTPDLLVIAHAPSEFEDGTAFSKALRASAEDPASSVPLFLVAQSITPELVAQARDAGVDALFTSPFMAKHLHARLRELASGPRIFVRSRTYAGPCRRRNRKEWLGAERRR